jgi:hypothetical protein
MLWRASTRRIGFNVGVIVEQQLEDKNKKQGPKGDRLDI